MTRLRRLALSASLPLILSVGCSKHSSNDAALSDNPSAASLIAIDGSSTVFPISEAMAEEFQKTHKARVTVAASGTGGGFKKLCSNEIAIAGASRPIKPTEIDACRAHGVDYIELPVAYDGIAIVVHRDNSWASSMTVEELKKLWRPEAQGEVKKWSDIREGWPAEEIHLFGAGVDSGTYDYFTKAVIGEEHKSRGDYTSSEDDNVLVRGISTDKLALGFFGFAYYEANKDVLKLLPIDDGDDKNGAGAIAPSVRSIEDGTYQPLSRPIFIYVQRNAANRSEVRDFVNFYLGDGRHFVREVGYIGLPASTYQLAQARFESRTPGTIFGGSGSQVRVSLADLLSGK